MVGIFLGKRQNLAASTLGRVNNFPAVETLHAQSWFDSRRPCHGAFAEWFCNSLTQSHPHGFNTRAGGPTVFVLGAGPIAVIPHALCFAGSNPASPTYRGVAEWIKASISKVDKRQTRDLSSRTRTRFLRTAPSRITVFSRPIAEALHAIFSRTRVRIPPPARYAGVAQWQSTRLRPSWPRHSDVKFFLYRSSATEAGVAAATSSRLQDVRVARAYAFNIQVVEPRAAHARSPVRLRVPRPALPVRA